MSKYGLLVLALVWFSCQNKSKDYLIQVPLESHIASEEILNQLESEVQDAPKNERLIQQQLYFCEQLGWPVKCEQVLIRAKEKWGLTEKLLDQSIAYYLKYEDYKTLATLLNGAFETRSRLETKILIASRQSPDDRTFLDRYLTQYQDIDALNFAAEVFIEQSDTTAISGVMERIYTLDPSSKTLLKYCPILESKRNFSKSIQIIENQLDKRNNRAQLKFNLALNYFEIDSLEKAKKLLRNLDSRSANEELIGWFRVKQEWDSALAYTNKTLASNPLDRQLILTKAEILESKGWVTPSLPFYEHAFALDTTDVELASHLEIVRRKVAYLRRKKEEENTIAPPDLERKTGN